MQKIITFFLVFVFCVSFKLEAQKTIGILTYVDPKAKPWDPDSIHSGITGSEEAVIYMSEKLVKLGYKVLVFGTPPENSRYTSVESNPRFVSYDFEQKDLLDIGIAWRVPTFGEALKNRAHTVYFWPHDTWGTPLTEAQINTFDDVLWLSKWQRMQWSSINPGFSKFTKVFGNGLNPEQFQEVSERKNPYSCIYSSNYGRGLEHLLDIWPVIKQEFPKATLDIYYGWQHWGVLTPEKEAKMRKQVEELKAFGVSEHGMIGHEELTRAFERTSLWTYPCTEPETFCITAIRAQLAGTIPVIVQQTGLFETTRSGFTCSKTEEYLQTLRKAMREVEHISLADRKKMGEFVLKEYTWEQLALKWRDLFESSSEMTTKPQKKTICLTMVVKDSADQIKASLESVKNVIDSWVILDKSSTDGTQAIIQECLKDIPGTLFERADDTTKTNFLNEALSLAKGKADYLLIMSSDEQLVLAEDLSLNSLNQDYYYSSLNADRELLINNHLNWKWNGVFEQQLVCPEAKSFALLPGIISSKEIRNSIPTDNPDYKKAVHAFYLAHSYFQTNDYPKALKYHKQVVDLKPKDFPLYQSLYYIGLLNELLGKPQETVIQGYCEAYQNNSLKAEPLFRLAVYYLNKQNNLMGYATAKLALSLSKPQDTPADDQWIYDHGIPYALGNCASNIGKYEEAVAAYELALSRPHLSVSMEKELKENLEKVKAELKRK